MTVPNPWACKAHCHKLNPDRDWSEGALPRCAAGSRGSLMTSRAEYDDD